MMSRNTFDKIISHIAIPQLPLILLGAQFLTFALLHMTPKGQLLYSYMTYVPALFLQGQVWRVFTYLFIPPMRSPIFFIFYLILFYQFSTSLENEWGTGKFTLFILLGWFLSSLTGFISPLTPMPNLFLYTSIFLAFATLNPGYELYLFFVLPVKIKWIGFLTGFIYFSQFVIGTWGTRLLILASFGNYLIFFFPKLKFHIEDWKRRREWKNKWK